jgi:hypothetical protein
MNSVLKVGQKKEHSLFARQSNFQELRHIKTNIATTICA